MAHSSYESLAAKLEGVSQRIKVGAQYRHYRTKGLYTVIALALDEETESPCVVYQTSHPSGLIWIRTIEDWEAMVETPDGVLPRFLKVT